MTPHSDVRNLVAPDKREKEVLAQLKRPSFQTSTCIGLRYLLFSELEQHCHGLCKFGDDYRILFKMAKDGSVAVNSILKV